jgi:hypothetical protein
MNLPVKRPTEFSPALVDEERIIDCVATQVAMVRHKLGTEYGLEFMADTLRNALREGRQPLTNYTIEAAEKRGDEICDAALRTVYLELASRRLLERGPSGSLQIHADAAGGAVCIEMAVNTFPEWSPGHLQLLAFGERAIERAPVKRPQGHRWHDDWMRNIQICQLIRWVRHTFGLRATRSRASRRANRAPSAISIVVVALARANVLHISEGSVQNIWFGLSGEIVRSAYGDPS